MTPSDVFIHPLACCESEEIGSGTKIWAFAHVMKGARIGMHCNIGDHAFIDTGARVGNGVTIKNHAMIWDGVEIADGCFIGPGVTFTNDKYPRSPRTEGVPAIARRYANKENWLERIRVGTGASVGAASVILPGVTIGAFATVSAGAVVTRDVPEHALVSGNPATRVGWVCQCGSRLPRASRGSVRCPACAASYELTAIGPQPSDPDVR